MKSTPNDIQTGQREGEARKQDTFGLLEARRQFIIRRARRALLSQLLHAGITTADDVAERVGPLAGGIDPRFLGTVPGPLADAGIIRDTGRAVKSSRPVAHARKITVWELDNRAAALAWLADHHDMPDPEPDDSAGVSCPNPPISPTPAPFDVATHQPTLF